MKPVTPLPWHSDCEGPKHLVCSVWNADEEVAEFCHAPDAAYIAHACNAYPKLVEALHALAGDGHAKQLALINQILREIGEYE